MKAETDFRLILHKLAEAKIDLPFAESKTAFGVEFLSVSLEKLILLKRAAGRPKDFELVARLEAARQEKIATANGKRPDHG